MAQAFASTPISRKPQEPTFTPDINIFVGTWNMRYQSIPIQYFLRNNGAYKIPKEAPRVASSPPSSLAESVTTPSTSQNFEEEKGTQVVAQVKPEPLFEESEELHRRIRKSTLIMRPPEGDEQPLRDWIRPNYDIYAISFQECSSDSIISAISLYLDEQHNEKFEKLDLGALKISGRGDGAFISTKSTSIAVWIRKILLHPDGPVEFVCSAKVSFGLLKGSKGAVSVALEVYRQRICFISCHMPASCREDRATAMKAITKNLARIYSGRKHFPLEKMFHHIIWAGDFNARLHGIGVEKTLKLISSFKFKELQAHDEFMSRGAIFVRNLEFSEPPLEFPPTYKKSDGRNPLDLNDPAWIANEYYTRISVNWYKGGGRSERVPAWTDRVLTWSLHGTEKCLTYIPGTYCSALPGYQSPLITSDHSPVSCGLKLSVADATVCTSKLPSLTCTGM